MRKLATKKDDINPINELILQEQTELKLDTTGEQRGEFFFVYFYGQIQSYLCRSWKMRPKTILKIKAKLIEKRSENKVE